MWYIRIVLLTLALLLAATTFAQDDLPLPVDPSLSVRFRQDAQSWDSPRGTEVMDYAVSPDGKWVVSSALVNSKPIKRIEVSLYSAASRSVIAKIVKDLKDYDVLPKSLRFSPDSTSIAMTTGDGVTLYGIPKLNELRSFQIKSMYVYSYRGSNRFIPSESYGFSANGGLFGAIYRHKTPSNGVTQGVIQIWDIKSGREKQRLSYIEGFYSLAFSPDERLVAAGCLDKTIRIWEMATGKEVGALKADDAGLAKQVLFHPDGRTLISVNHGQQQFTPDGKLLSETVGNVCFWDIDSGKLKRTVRDSVQYLCLSSDGAVMVAAGSLVTTTRPGGLGGPVDCIKLWTSERGSAPQVIYQKPPRIRGETSTIFTPGRVGFYDKSTRLWSVGEVLHDGLSESYTTAALYLWDVLRE